MSAVRVYSPALGNIARNALQQYAIKINPATKQAATNAPKIFSGFKTALGKLWSNKGVQVGAGLASTGIGLGFLNSQTQEVTKPLGEFGGIANFGLIIAIIAVFVLVVVLKR